MFTYAKGPHANCACVFSCERQHPQLNCKLFGLIHRPLFNNSLVSQGIHVLWRRIATSRMDTITRAVHFRARKPMPACFQ